MHEQTITIKGTGDGLHIALHNGVEWQTVMSDLAARIDGQSAFFSGAKITLDVGARPVRRDELGTVKALLERRGLSLWAVSSESQTTLDAAQALDLRVIDTTPSSAPDDGLSSGMVAEDEGSVGVLIRRTLRSGRSIHSQGHVVIMGDVNPGAEIIAGGDIVIWGKLRGNVHAGANGAIDAVVCALDMQPTQLRIAGQITTSPPDKRRKARPEVASIRDGKIIVEAWES